jgi:hypothetical protein
VTGAVQALAGLSNGSPNLAFSSSTTNTSLSTGIRTSTLTFASDGTATLTNATPPNWYNPTTTGVGSNWYVRVTTNTSANTTRGGLASGSWGILTSGQSVTFSNSATNNEATGNATVSFSPDNGTTVFTAGNVSWDVGFTP